MTLAGLDALFAAAWPPQLPDETWPWPIRLYRNMSPPAPARPRRRLASTAHRADPGRSWRQAGLPLCLRLLPAGGRIQRRDCRRGLDLDPVHRVPPLLPGAPHCRFLWWDRREDGAGLTAKPMPWAARGCADRAGVARGRAARADGGAATRSDRHPRAAVPRAILGSRLARAGSGPLIYGCSWSRSGVS